MKHLLDLLLSILSKSVVNARRLDYGQLWYVKLPKATSCSKIRVVDLTRETVLIDSLNGSSHSKTRYEISEIRWVEEIDGTEKV